MPNLNNETIINGITILFDKGPDTSFIQRIVNLEHLNNVDPSPHNLAHIYQDGTPVPKSRP